MQLAEQTKRADAARKRAETAEGVAKQAKEDIADERERLAYARNVYLAHLAYQDNNCLRANMFLDLCPEKLRGWDWRYVHRLCHSDLLTLKGHINGVDSVAFSPDGTRIVTGSEDKTAKVWDAKTGSETLTLKGHTREVTSVAFSPDGTRIVTGSWDQTAKVWDAKTGAEVLTLKGHTREVNSASFSGEGSRIVTGSGDQTAKVWAAKTGAEVLTLKGHTAGMISASFSGDGSRVVTGSGDQTAKVWDAGPSFRDALPKERAPAPRPVNR